MTRETNRLPFPSHDFLGRVSPAQDKHTNGDIMKLLDARVRHSLIGKTVQFEGKDVLSEQVGRHFGGAEQHNLCLTR